MIDIPEIWCEICHACSKPAPGRSPLMWMLPLYLHFNKKSDDDDDDDYYDDDDDDDDDDDEDMLL